MAPIQIYDDAAERQRAYRQRQCPAAQPAPPPCPWCALADLLQLLTAYGARRPGRPHAR